MVTVKLPVDPLATTADMLVALITVKDVTAVPPMVKDVAPVKLVPVTTMVESPAAIVGVKPVIVGAAA